MMIGKTNAMAGGINEINYDPSITTVDLSSGGKFTTVYNFLKFGEDITPSSAICPFKVINNIGKLINIVGLPDSVKFNISASGSSYSTPAFQISTSVPNTSILDALKNNGLKNLDDGNYTINVFASTTIQPSQLLGGLSTYTLYVNISNGQFSYIPVGTAMNTCYITCNANNASNPFYLFPISITKFEL